MVEELMKILRKTARALKTEDKKEIAVGVVGYPNTGKSSIINAMKHGRACAVNILPGTTKVGQEVQVDKSIIAIDCPGVIPANLEDVKSLILKQ